MTVPGQPAGHAVITEAVFEGYGEWGAFYRAVDELRRRFGEIIHQPPAGGRRFHLVLTVEDATDEQHRQCV